MTRTWSPLKPQKNSWSRFSRMTRHDFLGLDVVNLYICLCDAGKTEGNDDVRGWFDNNEGDLGYLIMPNTGPVACMSASQPEVANDDDTECDTPLPRPHLSTQTVTVRSLGLIEELHYVRCCHLMPELSVLSSGHNQHT